ncbi:MAG TPA: hypothetical protein VEA69_02705 [Tepidisphaeraceae bacterium]|nr:hypothetical protein [Tepidisphaeraceae bacterium]
MERIELDYAGPGRRKIEVDVSPRVEAVVTALLALFVLGSPVLFVAILAVLMRVM